mmetsp:Transcript_3638/g.13053  ORF Transcript_3638/g.13053 Transcript_3638/m.13053 type:complete len:241 (+) Transcript_3638:1048-1770(+)
MDLGLGSRHARCRFRLGRVRPRVDDKGVRDGAVGAPHLSAVEDEAVTTPTGVRLHGEHVRASARFAHVQSADMVAAHERRQELPFLRVRAEPHDLVHAQVGVRPIAQAHAPGRPRDLLHRYAVLRVPQRRAAILFGDRDPVETHVAHGFPQVDLGGEGVVFVDRLRMWSDDLRGKLADAQPEVHGGLVMIATSPHRGATAAFYPPRFELCCAVGQPLVRGRDVAAGHRQSMGAAARRREV